ETSSFQLERTYTFKPRAGILLNITSDHMDRHRCIEDYADMKLKLFLNQDISDYAIVNMDDSLTAEKIIDMESRENGPSLIKYSIEKKEGSHIWYGGGKIYYDFISHKGKINIRNALLAGMHNTSNAMAAAAASLIYGTSPENIGDSIRGFKPLSHRMEYLGEIAGIRCINDSKSTNPDSTIAALKDFTKEVTLIMGGKDKDMDFLPLLAFLDSAVNDIILIGQSAQYVEDLFKSKGNACNIFKCESLEEAVRLGFRITARGDVLLLSPGCASMDMFRDYRDRGDRFKSIVMSFKE
ncbi:MAG: UDP-N-acetylmuramoyl-L-alanine--D-glutamate ligase, partial [Actinomycetia bacterium]|nr:UDP-N-acetylmuramoyl-L-alanine--D-glutamate ligase [Actinomycetes bacterium]